MNSSDLLMGSFRAALSAADPLRIIPSHLPKPPKERTLVVGAGKAAASMALAVEQNWPKDAPLEGVVITRYGHSLPTTRIQVVEAGHPVPDERGEETARIIFESVKSLTPDDLLLCLVSGGGSSLLSLPVQGVPMADLKAVTRDLLRSGAAIQEMNTVRKHLSVIQGGRLAAECRAPALALVISDVTGDDPTHIASGPCAPDPTTYEDAGRVLERYEVNAPTSVMDVLRAGKEGRLPETPKPGDPIFKNVRNQVIATSHGALYAARHYLEAQRIPAFILGDSITGESREVAKVHAALVREIRDHAHPWPAPLALISGGETTVTVRGNGKGGRNVEYLLSLAIELGDMPGVYALACDTDGIDGSEDNAGATLVPGMMARATEMKLRADKYLENNDAYSFFEKLGHLVTTGPTRTNVNDFRVILIT